MPRDRVSVEVVEELDEIAAEWDALADRFGFPPFARPGWVRAWDAAFGVRRLALFTARVGGDLVGVLPLERRGGGLWSLSNAHTPELALVATGEDVLGALARAVFFERRAVVTLQPLERRSDALGAMEHGAREVGYHVALRHTARPPYIRGRATMAEYERDVSRNLRHDVERRLRRLLEVGAVCVQISDGTESLGVLLDEGFRVERAGWKGAEGTAISSQRSTHRFYTDVAGWAAAHGWLKLVFLRVDRRPIAFQFDLQTDRRYYSLKIAYDPAYARFSPGKLLTYAMVCRAMALGLESYELLGTDEPWKERWADGFREQVAMHAFAPSPHGRLRRSTFSFRRALGTRRALHRRVR